MNCELFGATVRERLAPFLNESAEIDWADPSLPASPIVNRTPGLEANSYYFGHPEWAASYFKYCHRNPRFESRWRAAVGSLDGKIVVDVGCGPGNVFATLGGRPELLVGVDISKGGLEMAREVGYTPILADAHRMPFVSAFADVVILNATLHHCDDMEAVLAESARLVKPGGVLVTDHDPQRSAWNFRGIARLLWNLRLTIYLWMKKGFHRSVEEQRVALVSEIHHEPGKGVTGELFARVLRPMGFEVEIFPHNHDVGEEALSGSIGRAARKFRIAQFLSGVNPNSRAAALSLLCRATKQRET